MLIDLARPEGSVKLMGLATRNAVAELQPRLEDLGRSMREQNVLASWTMIDLDDYVTAVSVGTMALQGAFFRPNLIFFRLPPEPERQEHIRQVIRTALAIQVGAVVFSSHPAAGLGEDAGWVCARSPGG